MNHTACIPLLIHACIFLYSVAHIAEIGVSVDFAKATYLCRHGLDLEKYQIVLTSNMTARPLSTPVPFLPTYTRNGHQVVKPTDPERYSMTY